jgi:hypothetical protein
MFERELKACVSGSFFKFKPEIDLAIEELNDLGITVLAPDKGWLNIPPQKIMSPKDYKFRRLPTEKGMPIKDIEDDFLSSVAKSDFLYVVNPNGYIGNIVAMEIGFAVALGIPVFLQQEASQFLDLDERWDEINPKLRICTIQEAIQETGDRKSK